MDECVARFNIECKSYRKLQDKKIVSVANIAMITAILGLALQPDMITRILAVIVGFIVLFYNSVTINKWFRKVGSIFKIRYKKELPTLRFFDYLYHNVPKGDIVCTMLQLEHRHIPPDQPISIFRVKPTRAFLRPSDEFSDTETLIMYGILLDVSTSIKDDKGKILYSRGSMMGVGSGFSVAMEIPYSPDFIQTQEKVEAWNYYPTTLTLSHSMIFDSHVYTIVDDDSTAVFTGVGKPK